MARVFYSHRPTWALLGLIAVIPIFSGQSGCPTVTPAPGPGSDQQAAPPSDTGRTTPDGATTGAPSVFFTAPAPGITSPIGEPVRIAFDAKDPENNFSYELFYDNDGAMNGNEVSIESRAQQGSSLVTTVWDTSTLPPGAYYIGALVVDNAGNTDSRFVGPIILSAEPTLQVTGPAAAGSVKVGDPVTIQFAGNDPGGAATIDVFYDTDNSFGNGVTYIVQGLGKTTTSAIWNTTGMTPGTYYVGASIGRSASGRVTRYAGGQITITSDGTPTTVDISDLDIKVTQPAGTATMDHGAQFTIVFQGTDPKGTATITLFYAKADANGAIPAYTGSEAAINTTPLVSTDTSFAWTIPDALDASVPYYVGASIGRPGSLRKAAWAPGRIFVRATTDGGGGGGGGGGVTPPKVMTHSVSEITAGGLRGTIFQGVNFNDFAGSSVAPIVDIDGDGVSDFVIVSQFGKPGWDNWGVDGASVGEAYVIFGGPLLANFKGQAISLNATGVNAGASGTGNKGLPGVVLTGLESHDPGGQNSGNRGGISGVLAVPDQDDDDLPELVFNFPQVLSENHDPHQLLGRRDQFLRGGLVMLSSQQPFFEYPSGTDQGGSRVIALDRAGQDFQDPATGDYITPMLPATNRWGYDSGGDPAPTNCKDATAVCTSPDKWGKDTKATGCAESLVDHGIGFTLDLITDNGFGRWLNGAFYYGGHSSSTICCCPALGGFPVAAKDVAVDPSSSYDFFGDPQATGGPLDTAKFDPNWAGAKYMNSGFYIGPSLPPYGMRLIGETDGDMFAQSVSMVDHMLLVSAPQRDGEGAAYVIQTRAMAPSVPRQYGVPHSAGGTNNGTGPYTFGPYDRDPGPRPYQYVVTTRGYQGMSFGSQYYPNTSGIPNSPTYGVFSSAGRMGECIGQHLQGTVDFNGDFVGDMLIGAPNGFNTADGYDNSGVVYLVYRRSTGLEQGGGYDLAALELDVNAPGRLHGIMVRGYAGDQIGSVVGTGENNNGRNFTAGQDRGDALYLNNDTLPDIVMGNHLHTPPADTDSGRGQVVMLFGNTALESPMGGYRIQDLLDQKLGAVINGENPGDQAGYNIAYAGDFDSDDKPDFMVSAPFAAGGAGKVYLIFGSNVFKGGDELSLADVGKENGIKGLVFVGKVPGDQLGGGEVAAYDGSPGTMGTTGMRARSISWAGDVNGDGFDDILIGAPLANVSDKIHAGEVYLVLGFRP